MALQSAWGNRAADSCAIAKFNAPILLFPHHAHSCSARKKKLLRFAICRSCWPRLGSVGLSWAMLGRPNRARLGQGPTSQQSGPTEENALFCLDGRVHILQWHRALAMITALGSIKPRPTPTEFSKHLWKKICWENFFYCVNM